MPGLRRLRDPRRGAGLHARARDRREKIVFISGIGCAARFPYYMNTYGMHSIHGRAPAIATGLSTSRPDLSVWVVTGDGDALSIGGNHLIHALRRNVNLKILLFNNRIYGLTKGQYSPTSEAGKVTKSTPYGSLDHPFDPLRLALGAEATFVARAIDTDKKGLTTVLRRAAAHRGAAFVEIYQNCNIFNDKAFEWVRDEKENRLYLEQGEAVGDTGLVHDEHDPDPARAMALTYVTMATHGKVPFGIFRDVERPVYDELMSEQIDRETAKRPGIWARCCTPARPGKSRRRARARPPGRAGADAGAGGRVPGHAAGLRGERRARHPGHQRHRAAAAVGRGRLGRRAGPDRETRFTSTPLRTARSSSTRTRPTDRSHLSPPRSRRRSGRRTAPRDCAGTGASGRCRRSP